jgi:hypothetical protein
MNDIKLQAENKDLKFKGIYTFTLRNAITGEIEGKHTYENLVPASALALVASLIGQTSGANAGKVTHCALGSGTTPPASGNTTLETEVYRNAIASLNSVGAVVYATGFFSAPETSGTYREAGIFINGTGTANSGTLLSRVAINITKTTSQTLTLDWTLTLTS